MTAIAKEYGLSDRGLGKLCERNSIPVPPRGYWAKKAAGHKVTIAPLIIVDGKEPDTIILLKRAKPAPLNNQENPPLPEAIQEAINREIQTENHIKVPATLHKAHAIVERWIENDKREAELNKRYGMQSLHTPVTKLDRRSRLITSTLFKALEKRGFKIIEEGGHHYNRQIWIALERDRISYQIRERVRQYRRKLTEEERANRLYSDQKWRQEREETGMLEIILKGENSYSDIKIQEEGSTTFEGRLNEIVIKVIETLWASKSSRLDKEEQERLGREADHQRDLRKVSAEKEEKRKFNLEYKAQCWKRAQSIREYIEAVEIAHSRKQIEINSSEFEEWQEWAIKYADELDFIKNGNPLISLTENPENFANSRYGQTGSYSPADHGSHWRKWYSH